MQEGKKKDEKAEMQRKSKTCKSGKFNYLKFHLLPIKNIQQLKGN